MSATKHLLYIGRRLNGEKLVQAFIDNQKEEFFWSGIQTVFIGRAYVATQLDGRLQMKNQPDETKWLGEPSDEEVEAWRLEDRKAREHVARKRAAVREAESRLVRGLSEVIKPHAFKFSYRQFKDMIELAIDDAMKERRAQERKEQDARMKQFVKRIKKSGVLETAKGKKK